MAETESPVRLDIVEVWRELRSAKRVHGHTTALEGAGDLMAETIERLRSTVEPHLVHRALALVETSLRSKDDALAIARQTGGRAPEIVQGILDGIMSLWATVEPSPEPVGTARGAEAVATIAAYLAWADETFPEATPASCVAHLRSEVEELTEAPDDAEELADATMLILHAAHKADVDLWDAVAKKLDKNRSREWGPRNAEGFREHVRAAPRTGGSAEKCCEGLAPEDECECARTGGSAPARPHAETDALRALDDAVGLHEGIEITYTVDGYDADFTIHDGATTYRTGRGPTIVDALVALANSTLASRSTPKSEEPT